MTQKLKTLRYLATAGMLTFFIAGFLDISWRRLGYGFGEMDWPILIGGLAWAVFGLCALRLSRREAAVASEHLKGSTAPEK